ncbi:MAG: trimethylamine methyltransferase family protein [Candidatus Ratteibacteria bacterium]
MDRITSKIIEGYKRILEEIGIEVSNEKVREELKKKGFKISNKRIFINEKIIDQFVEKCRKRNSYLKKEENERIQVYSGTHALFHFDPFKKK